MVYKCQLIKFILVSNSFEVKEEVKMSTFKLIQTLKFTALLNKIRLKRNKHSSAVFTNILSTEIYQNTAQM